LELIRKLNTLGVQLSVANNDLKIKAPKGVLTPSLISQIKEEKETLLNLISKSKSDNLIPSVETREYYPLSSSQRRLWVLSQFEGGNKAYSIPGVFKMNGALDVKALSNVFCYLIERHESLRTQFVELQDDVYQQIVKEETIKFTMDKLDVSEETVNNEITAFYQEEFNLNRAPLLKARILQIHTSQCYLLFAIHHIIGDGWSMEVFTKELIYAYNQLVSGKNIELPELGIQYKDYVLWNLSQERQENLLKQGTYWKNKLSGELPVLDLPTYKKRPMVKTFSGTTKLFSFSKEWSNRLNVFCKNRNVTLYMSLLAGINGLFHRYTGATDIILGAPIAGRSNSELEHQIGLYLNTLAIRTTFNRENSFTDLLKEQKKTLLEAYENQEYPFDSLVEELELKRDTSRSALFDVLVVLQNQKETSIALEGLKITPYQQVSTGVSQFDMTFSFSEDHEGIHLRIEYNDDIYEKTQIDYLCVHLERFIEAAIAAPDQSISNLPYLTNEERTQLVETFNNTKTNYPESKTVVDLFREQVIKNPNAIAIVFEEIELTYRQIDQHSNVLAQALLETGLIEKETLIGVQLQRTEWLVISLLAVFKAGAAYVPIDPSYPKQRIDYIKKDSQCAFVITEEYLSEFKNKDNKTEPPKTSIDINQLAYVIYTSGSTGKPKGVMIEHNNTSALIQWANKQFNKYHFDIAYFTTSHCFDLSVFEVFYPLSTGKAIRVIKHGLSIPDYLIKDKNVLVNTVPSVIQSFIENKTDLSNISILNMAGEVIPPYFTKHLSLCALTAFNLYGPSEDTTYSTYYQIKEKTENSIPIGKPISNTQVYILSETNNLQPIGVIGELCLSGKGLSRGYLYRNELTKEKFVAHPFRKKERLYKTGDLARWLPDGNIEFIGRKDHQVKIRGYRIELGEIEDALINCKGVSQAVVTTAKNNEDKFLVGYFVGEKETDIKKLKNSLREFLPEYMIPAYLIQINTIPLTPNGKTDKKALPAIDINGSGDRDYIAPQNEVEKQLAAIWQVVLGMEKVGVTDNFFELGGHSLKVVLVINKIRSLLNKTVTFDTFFQEPYISNLAKNLEDCTIEKIEPVNREDYPLTPLQKGIWVQDALKSEEGRFYNLVSAVNVTELDLVKLEKTLEIFTNAHAIFKTSFTYNTGGELRQFVDQKWKKPNIFHSDKSPEEIIREEEQRQFDLKTGDSYRFILCNHQNKNYLICSIHHMISDGWSMFLIKNEIIKRYNDQWTDSKNVIEFKDYAEWMHRNLNEDWLLRQKEYWLENFRNSKTKIELPSFIEENTEKIFSYKHEFSQPFTNAIYDHKKESSKTLFGILLAGLKSLLFRYTSQNELVIAVPYANRTHESLENVIGPTLNTILVKTNINNNATFKEIESQTTKSLNAAIQNSIYPFELWSKELPKEATEFNVMAVLQNFDHINTVNEKDELFQKSTHQNRTESQYDLIFRFEEHHQRLYAKIDFNKALFNRKYIKRLIQHFEILLTNLIHSKNLSVAEVDYLTREEKIQLDQFNSTAVNCPTNKSVVDLLEKATSKMGSKIALRYNDEAYSLEDIDALANKFGRFLAAKASPEPGDKVIVKLPKNAAIIYCLLGVLKTGACYVPIDISYPEERIHTLESMVDAKITVDQNLLDEFNTEKDKIQKTPLRVNIDGKSDFHIMFTSGTTGKPKGVVLSHSNIVNFITTSDHYFPINKNTVLLSTVASSFDTTNMEFWSVLYNGGTLIIADQNDLYDYGKLKSILQANKVNTLWLTASWFAQIVDGDIEVFSGLKQFISGGDILSVEHIKKLKKQYPDIEIYNGYGPTENTTFSTVFKINTLKEDATAISIGSPLPNTKVYVLNSNYKEQPVGVEGEIYVAGANLAKGYYNRPHLTKTKFLKNPFDDGVFYATGDIGNWNESGNIVFKGRRDNQVKIRGYRIELDAIEKDIYDYSNEIKQVIVDKREDNTLIAYMVANKPFKPDTIKAYLSKKMPGYMVPAHYLKLEEIPLTPNGKTDRKALAQLPLEKTNKITATQPANVVEKKIMEIWQEVLARQYIGIDENFYDLGGESLKMIAIMNKVNTQFNLELTFHDFYDVETIKELSNIVIEKKLLM
jgi:amino acid adenylation domain-containing protein